MILGNRQSGFTLTEIAIVMLVIGLALVGALGPVNRLFQISQTNANQERLDAARDALLAFAAINGRLPCPDRTGDGVEDRNASGAAPTLGCTGGINEGFLPWVTLGVQQTDYWGTRFRYRVSAEFTRSGTDPNWICGVAPGTNLAAPPTALAGCIPGGLPTGCTATASNPNSCTFDISDTGDIPVRDGQVGRPGSVFLMNSTVAPPSGAVAVVLSHGPNRVGGTSQDGTVYPVPAGGTDEALNGPALGAIAAGARLAANPFIMRPPLDTTAGGCSDNGGANLCLFDDQLVFIGANTLVNRMIQSGLRLR